MYLNPGFVAGTNLVDYYILSALLSADRAEEVDRLDRYAYRVGRQSRVDRQVR